MISKIKYKGKEIFSPKMDIIFKALFGSEDDKELLAAFIKEVLELPIESGRYLELYNVELPPDFANGKLFRIDLRARLETGQQVHIEMQVEDLHNTIPRNVLYNCRLAGEQLKASIDYSSAVPTISLVITDFALFKDNEKWYNKYTLKNTETNEDLTDLIQIAFMELPKAREKLKEILGLDGRSKWALFLAAEDEEVLKVLAENDKHIDTAVKKLVLISEDEKIRYAIEKYNLDKWEYEMYEKKKLEAAVSEATQEATKKGLQEGMQEGLQQGMQEGLQQGMQQGMQEGIRQSAVAMKKKGISIADIAEMTGLTMAQIEEL